MARGKYSPTVSAAYMKDPDWFRKYCGLAPHGDVIYSPYDPDGFDSYGYDKNDIDRAGNDEFEYLHNDAIDRGLDDNYDFNFKYDDALGQWGFDGAKPVLISQI
jgi:hypothetical protein